MNDTVKAIVEILESGRPELQVAAAQILGELRPKDAVVAKALEVGAGRSHVLGRYALEALSKLGTLDAQRAVVRCLWQHDALADQASHVLADQGAAAHAVLAEGFDQAPAEKRARFLPILGRHVDKEAIPVFLQALRTPDLAGDAGRVVIAAAAQQFGPSLQKSLRDGLIDDLEQSLPETCLVQILAVLGKIDPAGSRVVLQRFVASGPAPVRIAALRGMVGSKLAAPQVKELLDLLEDPQQKSVHEVIREVLTSLPEWPAGLNGLLKRLLVARQPEQRLFALRVLKGSGGAEMAKVALKYLTHEDPRFREAAAAALATNTAAIEPVAKLLLAGKDDGLAPVCAGILVAHKAHFPPKLVRAFADKSVKSMAAHSAAGDAMFDVVVQIDGAKIAPQMLAHAARLRRSRRYAEALHLLAKLATTPHLDQEGRYQLAVTRLLHDMTRPAFDGGAPGNPTMGFFAVLAREGFPLVERLRKESMLTPEGLLRLAIYFAGTVGPERRFGSELLQHLATRVKGHAAQEARLALRQSGIG
ncbi:MAG: hypothetical protein IPK26_30615 [Planctomycetes bacterium]|nr:hypothetical protein [Planctomycetota bacterium]